VSVATASPSVLDLDAGAPPAGRGPALRAFWGLMRLEWRRQLLTPRVLWPLLLALLPIGVTAAIAWVVMKFGGGKMAGAHNLQEEYANLYHGLIVRVVLFFGSLALFVNLVRGEVEERTFHYLLLTPVRRWAIVAAKYLAAVGTGWLLFVSATAASFVLVNLPEGLGRAFGERGLSQLFAYCGMSALGVVGYGAAFLLLGTLLRSPGYLVAVFFGWEWFEFLLPPLLKQLSVVHYIKGLTPFPISEGPFALLADPMPAWQAVLKVLVYALVAVAIAAWVAGRQDLDYGKG
jgi:ABC-type transport system involved in multi-copper enzyme maturation permease subunit